MFLKKKQLKNNLIQIYVSRETSVTLLRLPSLLNDSKEKLRPDYYKKVNITHLYYLVLALVADGILVHKVLQQQNTQDESETKFILKMKQNNEGKFLL